MHAHRLVKARHAAAALEGEGARLVGGRWNTPGQAVVYCASSLALAALELLVQVDPRDLPGDLVAIEAELPEDLPSERLDRKDLPESWREESSRSDLRALGDLWLRSRRTAILIVPSVVVPSETNLLINPAHPEAARIRIVGQESFCLDPRLTALLDTPPAR
jgi:RES domain-containing protein